jgi:DNA-binding HxlR family transcriptional regulator
VIDALETGGELRFSQLRQRLPGVSQKMLTKTLRQLERNGLVSRRVHASVPPRVDYRLTALGESLGEALCGLWAWMSGNLARVENARQRFDSKGMPRESDEA